jgi:hypothetical protein
MTSVSRPTRYLSILSSPITNMSIGSPLIYPPQMPSKNIFEIILFNISSLGDYARQVLDNALADLMECSM